MVDGAVIVQRKSSDKVGVCMCVCEVVCVCVCEGVCCLLMIMMKLVPSSEDSAYPPNNRDERVRSMYEMMG